MKKLAILICLYSAVSLSASAQKLYGSNHPKVAEWTEHPGSHTVPPEYASEPAVFLLHDVDVKYKYQGSRDTNTFYTLHNIIKVLDERGIESFNTLNIPVNSDTTLITVKARTISPSGKVQDIARNMIKVTKDETGSAMIAIAMEGVEKNSEIEYQIKQTYPYHFFNKLYFQFGIPVLNAYFNMSYPKGITFEMRSYNGFPELRDTLINGRKRVAAEMHNIPAMETEPYSYPNLQRMAIEYRASYYSTGNNERIKLRSWNELSRMTFDEYYKFTEKDRKAVNKFLSDIGVHANGNERDNIRKIEQAIKTQITLYPVVNYDQRHDTKAVRTVKSVSRDDVAYDEAKDLLDTVLSKKAATPYGYRKLFAACFVQAGVKNELGFAGKRSENQFDAQFEDWNHVDDVLFYFPNQKKFLDPENIYLRYPVISEDLVGGKGIFCTIPQKGEVTGKLYAIRNIAPLSVRETGKKMIASVSFSENMDPSVDVAYSWYGYAPTQLRETLPFYPKYKMKELITSLIPFADKPDDIEKYTISNEGFENYFNNKPLELYAYVHPTRLVSKTDKQYLFRLGAMAGTSGNLYAEDQRKLPVDLDFPYNASRTITIWIPKDYKVVNPDEIRMSADYINDNEQEVMAFNSSYKLIRDKKKGDKLVVTVSEYFNQIHFGLNEYERFRKVVNTAADFNKVTLILERTRGMAHHRAKTAKKTTGHKAIVTTAKPEPIKAAPVKVAPIKAAPAQVKPAPTKAGQIKVGPPRK